MFEGEHLIVVRRGETRLFQNLLERFARGPSTVRVIWDRRMRDRRVIIRDDVASERREVDRRAPVSPSWTAHGFVLTQARAETGGVELRSRVTGPFPAGPRGEDVAERPSRLTGVTACRHLWPRRLRTDDDDYLRLYARQLRESGHHVPGDWPQARLRVYKGSAA